MITVLAEHALAIGSARHLIEASELQLPPGVWPKEVATDLGNGRPCYLMGTQPDGTHVYLQEFGVTRIAILND